MLLSFLLLKSHNNSLTIDNIIGMGRKKGFTLVELLVAIAVIGILISLLIPAVSKVLDSARKSKGSNNVKQIALAYNQYAFDVIEGRNIQYNEDGNALTLNDDTATSITEWATVLARKGFLNDPNVYCFSGDSGCNMKVIQKSIANNKTATTTNAWEAQNTSNDKVFSVCVITNIPPDAPLSTTPVLFTRGLELDGENVGKWSSSGVYSTKGGFIGFLDGHVEWFENLGDSQNGKLINYSTGQPTNNILAAVPSSCYFLLYADSSADTIIGKGD